MSRYLKRAKESVIGSNIDYVMEALHSHSRASLGQDRVLKGLWSIVEDHATVASDKLRAYHLIMQCNSKKSQATNIARELSKWKGSEEKKMKDKEWDKLRRDEQIIKMLEQQTPIKPKDTESSHPNHDISDFMNGM